MQEDFVPASELLNRRRIAAYIDRQSYWSQLQVVAQTASTNADLAAMAENVEGRAVRAAEWQTAGRGRLDRNWDQGRSRGLAVSFILRPSVAVTGWGTIPLLSGLAVLDACHASGIDATLKWPNDVLAASGPRSGTKLGGILTQLVNTQPPIVVVGIGLNVLESAAELPPTATSLVQEASGRLVDRTEVLIALLEALSERCVAWESGVKAIDDYRASCSTLGKHVEVTMPGAATIRGIAEDIDEQGRLCIRTDDQIVAVAAGDVVHVRRADADG